MVEPKYRAVLVGNDTFPDDPHNLPKLPSVVDDLTQLREALTDPEFGLFERDNVDLVPNQTSGEIIQALDVFFNSARAGDQLLFYYGGHGVRSQKGQLLLCGRNSRTDRPTTTVKAPDIVELIEASPAMGTVVILDCCHSGAFRGANLAEDISGDGRFVLASCRSEELAPSESLFTRCLIEGIRTGDADRDNDGLIGIEEMYEYLHDRLATNGSPIPQRSMSGQGMMPIARSHPRTVGATPSPASAAIELSTALVDFGQVRSGDNVAPEPVFVRRSDGQSFEWSATTGAAWLDLDVRDEFFLVSARPTLGRSRGSIVVHDRRAALVARCDVVVEMLETEAAPVLELLTSSVDFGTLEQRSRCPNRLVAFRNDGGGSLVVRVRSVTDDRVKAEIMGDGLSLTIDTTGAGPVDAVVDLESNGGRAELRLVGEVTPGPAMLVWPDVIHFGTVPITDQQERLLAISNIGAGDLRWEPLTTGDFFTVSPREGELTIRLLSAKAPGAQRGVVRIHSNGGDSDVAVYADRIETTQAPPPPQSPGLTSHPAPSKATYPPPYAPPPAAPSPERQKRAKAREARVWNCLIGGLIGALLVFAAWSAGYGVYLHNMSDSDLQSESIASNQWAIDIAIAVVSLLLAMVVGIWLRRRILRQRIELLR